MGASKRSSVCFLENSGPFLLAVHIIVTLFAPPYPDAVLLRTSEAHHADNGRVRGTSQHGAGEHRRLERACTKGQLRKICLKLRMNFSLSSRLIADRADLPSFMSDTAHRVYSSDRLNTTHEGWELFDAAVWCEKWFSGAKCEYEQRQ